MDFSIQSNTVKTEMMQKIPIVIPKRERNILSLLTNSEVRANVMLSLKSLKNILISQFIVSIEAEVKKIGKTVSGL